PCINNSCRSSKSSQSSPNFFAAACRDGRSHPFVSSTPPISKNNAVTSLNSHLAKFQPQTQNLGFGLRLDPPCVPSCPSGCLILNVVCEGWGFCLLSLRCTPLSAPPLEIPRKSFALQTL